MKIVVLIFLGFFSIACGGPAAYNIRTTNSDDTVRYGWEKGTATFEISSPGGIGGASITHGYGNAPQKIYLQLELKGLESLKFRFDNDEVTISYPSSGSANVMQSARIDGGAETQIGPNSEYWMPTEIVSVMDTIPLVDGYFQVEPPHAFFKSDTRDFSVEWVDFFR